MPARSAHSIFPTVTYDALKAELLAAGLFEKRPLFYITHVIFLFLGIVGSLYVVTATTNIWLQTLNAVFLGIVSMHLGYIGHDIAHHQVFSSPLMDRWIGSTIYSLGIGVSLEHWYGGHNEHHKYTNTHEKDPDIALPLVFSEIQLRSRGKAYRTFVLPHQHWYFFLFMPLAYLNYIIASIPWNLRTLLLPIRRYEFLLFIIHFCILFWIVFGSLGLWMGIYFLAIYAIVTGGYAGFTFAPNHKGQEILPTDRRVTYKTQITSTRNIHGGPIADVMMGGLNYQIEHHLFPDLPRLHLAKAKPYVKAFCAREELPYHEVSFWGSVIEMYRTLRHFSRKPL